jgi:hypothetical protein
LFSDHNPSYISFFSGFSGDLQEEDHWNQELYLFSSDTLTSTGYQGEFWTINQWKRNF